MPAQIRLLASERAVRRLRRTLGAVALLFLLFFQVLNSAHDASLTADEPVHILRGYALWRTGDFRLQHGHPPLLHLIIGAPLLFESGLPSPHTLPGWESADRLAMANHLFQGPQERVDRIVWLARYPIALLALLLAAIVFRWARQWLGPVAALAALAFLVFDPNIIAHAGLATTDLGVTAFFFAAVYAFQRALRQPSAGRLVIAGVLFGLAQAAKLSALILGPAFVLIALVSSTHMSPPFVPFPMRGEGSGAPDGVPAITRLSVYRIRVLPGPLLSTLAVFIIGGLVLWAVYGFRWGWIPEFGLSLPAPAYWSSLTRLQEHEETGHRAYLLGQISSEGWWYYFPVAFLVKTPLPTLIALGLAALWRLWVTVRRKPGAPEWDALYSASLLAPLLAYLAASVNSSLNIGYRHILPVLPLAFVFAAQIACLAHPALRLPSPPPQVGDRRLAIGHWANLQSLISNLPILLLLWLVVEAIAIQPYPLAYFNELAGGPAQGYRVLADSNLDWGQDLKRLAAALRAWGIERPWLSYFGGADPALYGIEYQRLPAPPPSQPTPDYHALNPAPGIYAISASNLVGVRLDEPDAFYIFRQREPFAHIGYSIFLYRIEPAAAEGDWVGACYAPDRPYDDAAIRQGFGMPDLRIAQFDCRSGWLYAEGGRAGWYVIPVDTEGATLADRFLSGADILFRSRRTERHPPFTVYYWPGGTGQAFIPADPPVDFNGILTFLGYRLEREQVAPGDAIHLDTVWRVTSTGLGPVSIFAHLIAPDEHLAGAGDGLGVPPDSWAVGDVIVQTHTIPVPADAAPGSYWLQTGVYSVPDGQRFSIRGGSAPGADRLRFVRVRIAP